MNVHRNNTYSKQTIELDDNAFRECVFEDCTLRFSAAGPTELSGCTFARSELIAGGAAELTFAYLRGFYQGLGEWGRSAVEKIFETIRGSDGEALDGALDGSAAADVPAGYRAALEAFGATPEGQLIVAGFERLAPPRRRQIADLIGAAAQQGG
ncbi:MAG TPA: hypothetical protein VHY34_09970 [Caulobacteraceae bacterium]|jgi:hypothetical protein|nr:hypothetical protein [Caulobacteraceae bacterium]